MEFLRWNPEIANYQLSMPNAHYNSSKQIATSCENGNLPMISVLFSLALRKHSLWDTRKPLPVRIDNTKLNGAVVWLGIRQLHMYASELCIKFFLDDDELSGLVKWCAKCHVVALMTQQNWNCHAKEPKDYGFLFPFLKSLFAGFPKTAGYFPFLP